MPNNCIKTASNSATLRCNRLFKMLSVNIVSGSLFFSATPKSIDFDTNLSNSTETEMTNSQEQKMMDFLDAFETVNEQLMIALKQCVELLNKLQPPGEDKKTLKKIFSDIQGIIAISENIVQKRHELLK